MSQYYKDSVFWVEVDKIKPNPFQPRREFEQGPLESLADSIRQYGVLQALVVTRKEIQKEDGGLAVEYELIAGERRLRASKIAGLREVPVLIKTGDETDLMKLELAIIENIQREDLNPIDRARAFDKLATEFKFKHADIAKKVGKSREYVSNTIRLLSLPEEIVVAVEQGKISEGHTRPLLMLGDRPAEQFTLFKEIMYKKLTVREAEAISRKIATDKVRKKEFMADPELAELEERISESLGTRVAIERKDTGGKLVIDFFSNDDIRMIANLINSNKQRNPTEMMDKHIEALTSATALESSVSPEESTPANASTDEVKIQTDDRSEEEKKKMEESEDIYSVSHFSI